MPCLHINKCALLVGLTYVLPSPSTAHQSNNQSIKVQAGCGRLALVGEELAWRVEVLVYSSDSEDHTYSTLQAMQLVVAQVVVQQW